MAAVGYKCSNVYSQCLVTDMHSCTRHRDPDYFSYVDSHSVRAHWTSINHPDVNRFVRSLDSTFPNLNSYIPAEARCAWTLREKCDSYAMFASFVNLTAQIGVDVSSEAFDSLDIIGSTFLGACFEHCSPRPIWVGVKDGYVRVSPPPEAPHNTPFAWGTHAARARLRAQEQRRRSGRRSGRSRT